MPELLSDDDMLKEAISWTETRDAVPANDNPPPPPRQQVWVPVQRNTRAHPPQQCTCHHTPPRLVATTVAGPGEPPTRFPLSCVVRKPHFCSARPGSISDPSCSRNPGCDCSWLGCLSASQPSDQTINRFRGSGWDRMTCDQDIGPQDPPVREVFHCPSVQ